MGYMSYDHACAVCWLSRFPLTLDREREGGRKKRPKEACPPHRPFDGAVLNSIGFQSSPVKNIITGSCQAIGDSRSRANMPLLYDFPAFPDDVEVLDLPRLSHANLLSDKASDSLALFNASTDHGFFLLDLSDTAEGRDLLADLDKAFETGRTFFNQDLEEKKKFVVNASNVG